ncbi:hypothetical protein AB6A40_011493 [Gnathostoma spinigerum]|uniref:Maturase K n=1 Tax=Gnathostoma spinigerum TaxID=75299 RepID=A0ABD6F3G6_9BILA
MPRELADSTPKHLRALQRALRMPQCRLIPFLAYHLKSHDAIVRDGMHDIAVIGRNYNGHTLRDQWVIKQYFESLIFQILIDLENGYQRPWN